ncbi:MAG: SDR family oxidoreductase [Deltaproteobacteria bacterium]|nr:SDR family oxidoreductase [Deltaproteobacteria bacterium]MBW2395545.1 SDR family oxidoreductase [Deltaproteobacteria bacterium]
MNEIQQAFGLGGRVAVVTGAASGIGRSVAEVLARAGARVVLGDLDAAGAEEVAAAIRAAGGEALAQRVDVSQRSEVETLVERATGEWGGLDVMCNVAGIPADGPLAELGEDEFDRVVGVNVKGTLFGCQAATAAMASRGRGSIINVASAAIDLAVPNYGLYALTKAAVTQLSQTLAVEVGPQGIRVNVLAPGITLTNFTARHSKNPDGSVDQERYDGFISAMQSRSPLGIVGETIDQAWLVLYLASDASRYCTGQIWRANGGATIPH